VTTTATERPASEVTARAVAFVAAHRQEAEGLGRSLADTVHDPDAFARELESGFERLADPDYQEGEQRIAPGLGPVLGVRWPLNAAVARGFRGATKGQSPTTLLYLADRLFRSEPLEMRWFAFGILERLVPDEPERAWQLLRRAAREAVPTTPREALADVLGETLDDLRAEQDPRRAVIAAYARMERALAAAGLPRTPSEAPEEYLDRALDAVELSSRAAGRLTALFAWARFSVHDVRPEMKDEAIETLEQVHHELATAETAREAQLAGAHA